MEQSDRIIISGQLRKKGSRVSTWTDRYFVLKDHTIYYYLKSSDVEPKHALPLHANCVVSKIWPEVTKKRKQFVFKISWKVEDINGTTDEGNTDRDIAIQREEDGNLDESSSSPRVGRNLARTKTRNLADGKDPAKESKDGSNIRKAATAAASGSMFGALTSGLGLMTGMLAVGIGSTPTNPPEGHSKQPTSENQKSLTLACDTYQDAENWVTTIESQILELSGHLKDRDGDRNRYRSAKHIPRPEVRLAMVEKWVTTAKWKLFATHEGIRILQPQNYIDNDIGFYESFFVTNDSSSSASNKNQQSLPCLRVNIPINASIADTFTCIMNFSQSMRSGVIKSIRTVQTLDNFTDIIHLKLEPVYLHPSWTAPRDFCLMRYWRDNSDGSYVICLDSATHDDCPLVPGFLRAEMHAAYVIVPPTNKVRSNPSGGAAYMDDEGECTECMLTFVAQMDCKGWIWRSFGYQKHFLQEIMLHVLDVRDALDTDRFLHVHFDPVFDAQSSKSSNDGGAGAGAKSGSQVAEEQGSVATIPPSILSPSMWSNADASTFKVRGGSYNQDKVKVSSGPALFKLIGIDLFEVPEATHNIAAHPNNRVYLANQRGEKSWVFVFNIMVPGPPFLSFVAYFLADKSKMYEDTPFGRIARPFFDGNDDEFRNNRFKLIPKIVDGNMIIKMAVKDTPTLLGNKLKQYYYKDEHYFELDFCRYEMMNAMVTSIMNYSIDVGSSSVARNVVGLAMGYSKNIVVDMGLCLQGNDENELPEVLMGTCSCIHVDASTAKKL